MNIDFIKWMCEKAGGYFSIDYGNQPCTSIEQKLSDGRDYRIGIDTTREIPQLEILYYCLTKS